MAVEGAMVKVVVDALLGALDKARSHRLKKSASTALSEAIRELLQVNPKEDRAAAKIAAARAAGIIDEELFLAERMLSAVRAARTGKAGKKKAGRKPGAKKVARRKTSPN